MDRHSTWEYLIKWTSEMADKYGGTVYGKNGKSWDWGQALCVDVFGDDWMKNDGFQYNEATIRSCDPAPREYLESAQKWEAGNHPNWVDVSRFKK